MFHEEQAPSPSDSVAVDGQAPAEREAAFPVVGVGASAGGPEALALLLRVLPADMGMGFVIVQHLAPDHESSLAEILSRATKMKVREVREWLEGLTAHLDHACVGSINEIFDAEEPYTPRGCIAQAWSVAEALRCWVKTAPNGTQPSRL